MTTNPTKALTHALAGLILGGAIAISYATSASARAEHAPGGETAAKGGPTTSVGAKTPHTNTRYKRATCWNGQVT